MKVYGNEGDGGDDRGITSIAETPALVNIVVSERNILTSATFTDIYRTSTMND